MKRKLAICYLYFTIFITGAAVLVIEILGTRVLAPFYGSTIYVWSSLITVTLGALALGYFTGGYVADTHPKQKFFYGIISIAGLLLILLVKINEPILLFSDRFGFEWGPLVASFLLFSIPLFFLGMVTPFAIRLLTPSVEHSGHVSGRIFAVATMGSVIGAILAGFYLIPNFSFPSILIFSGIFLAAISLTGLFLEQNGLLFLIFTALLAFAIFFFPFKTKQTTAQILYRSHSFYGTIEVFEHRGLRCLAVENQAQGCVRTSDGQQASLYEKLISALLRQGTPASGKALWIGLGSGVSMQDLLDHFSGIDVVEVDPKIAEASKAFFDFNDSDSRLRVYFEDGRRYIETTDKKYDAIIIDAFSGINLIPHLLTRESFDKIKNILTPNGMLVLNISGRPFGKGELLPKSVFRTLDSTFPHLRVISTQNIAKNPEAFDNIVFQASLEEKSFPVPEASVVKYNPENTPDGILLTDAYNPLETIGLPVYEEMKQSYRKFIEGS